jgi:membrane-associated protease RseP (regulator of RpoE activity)
MSFFDNLKKSIGIKGTNQSIPQSKGNILGTGNKPQQNVDNSESQPYSIFEKVFNEEKMGLSIIESKERLPMDNTNAAGQISRPVVHTVAPGSEGNRLGIIPGDIILSLNGMELTHFDDFYNFIKGLGRPLTLK